MNKHLSLTIWFFSIAIMGFGLLALYSATFGNVRVSQNIFWDQALGVVMGLSLMFLMSQLDYRRYFDAAYFFYGLNVFLLLMVLWIGRHALGATRWISLGGFSFQPSEIMKVSLILMLARYFTSRRASAAFSYYGRIQKLALDLIMPLGMTLLPMFLIFKQPDLGTSLLLFGIFVPLLFLSGISNKIFLSFLSGCVLIMPLGWMFLKDYQKSRLLVFLNPNIDPLGAGYTIIQSRIAVGSGGFWGKGWFAGTQNQLNFLPERHTDFIFSVIGEEWGFLGAMLLVLCFAGLIHAGMMIALKTKDRFGMFLASGIVSIISVQAAINIGMVMGLFPVVGLTLPLISYGRTSFLVTCFMLGILLNLAKRRTIF